MKKNMDYVGILQICKLRKLAYKKFVRTKEYLVIGMSINIIEI